MGTNFYLMTKSKEVRDKWFGFNYELTDTPDWGYRIHIAKTSAGWLPLFQAHDKIKSVKQLQEAYNTDTFMIVDEYGTLYTWGAFDKRVLQHNGGVYGVAPKEKTEADRNSLWYDPKLPEYRPISHCPTPDSTYNFGVYANQYFKDDDGYEFTFSEFS